MAGKKNDLSGGDHLLIRGAGLFLLYALFEKAHAWFLMKMSVFENRILFAFIISVSFTSLFYWLFVKYQRVREKRASEKAILGKGTGSVYCGVTSKNEPVHIKPSQRAMHTQIIGTTNAGKTESVILPWAIQDMEQGRGLILIDGKSDRSLLDKLWAYACKHEREKDFRLFSLSHIEESFQFNPLIGGCPEEVAERVFNAFDFENEYYRSVQYEVFSQTLRVFDEAKEVPTFIKVHEAISSPSKLKALAGRCENLTLKHWVESYCDLSQNDRLQRTSGLLAAISHFAFGRTSILFNSENPSITLENALRENQIVYFQLPVLLFPFLGKTTGKMILQCLQSAVANRHRGRERSLKFFSVFLDDFSEYLYPGFVSILNKSRSANVGVVFAHQALGDIQTMGEAVENSILTNANIKVFMRGNDPRSTEYFSQLIGTVKSIKYTAQTEAMWGKRSETGSASAREVDEFRVHPNKFKNELGVGQAYMVVPHAGGSKTIQVAFEKYDDLPALEIPKVEKEKSRVLSVPEILSPEVKGL